MDDKNDYIDEKPIPQYSDENYQSEINGNQSQSIKNKFNHKIIVFAVIFIILGITIGVGVSYFLIKGVRSENLNNSNGTVPQNQISDIGNIDVIVYPENIKQSFEGEAYTSDEEEELQIAVDDIQKIAPILAQRYAEWYLSTNDLENIPDSLQKLENDAFNSGVKAELLYFEPSNINEFISNKSARRVCIASTHIFGGGHYAVAGNSCDENSLGQVETRKEEESLDYKRINHVNLLDLVLENYQLDNEGNVTDDQSKLLEQEFIFEIYKDPVTDVPYKIKITNDGTSYCVVALLTRFKANMTDDDGNDPELYEQGPGCK